MASIKNADLPALYSNLQSITERRTEF